MFNGTSGRVDVATATRFGRYHDVGLGQGHDAVGKRHSCAYFEQPLGHAASRVGFHLMLQSNGTAASRYQTQADGVGVWSVSGTTNVTGAWHHLTYVKKGTRISIVVDGKEEGALQHAGSITGLAVLNQIRIGCNPATPGLFPASLTKSASGIMPAPWPRSRRA